MRCPYCGGLNQERAAFCTNCGRDLTHPPRLQTAQPPHSGSQAQERPGSGSAQTANRGSGTHGQSAGRGGPPARPAQSPPAPAGRSQQKGSGSAPQNVIPAAPPAPEPPAPFPPHTLEQFHQLLAAGAQPYTVVESLMGDGRRKQVRIAYSRCTGWQQAATLLKALKDQQDEKCDAITVQGVLPQQSDVYAFTNGQLLFERDVRLGGQTGNRYVVETENGFASTATRFVLNEY
jgi:hypothetical protein